MSPGLTLSVVAPLHPLNGSLLAPSTPNLNLSSSSPLFWLQNEKEQRQQKQPLIVFLLVPLDLALFDSLLTDYHFAIDTAFIGKKCYWKRPRW